jgi:hypothetical protein
MVKVLTVDWDLSRKQLEAYDPLAREPT